MRVVVAPLRSFPSGERRIVEVGGRSIGVFRQSFMGALAPGVRSYGVELSPGGSLGGDVRAGAPAKRVPGPYVAETFEVNVEDEYVVLHA